MRKFVTFADGNQLVTYKMAKKKKQLKAKEPIALRQRPLSNGGYSLYLDIYKDGNRQYEFLKLYLVPEKDEAAARQNGNTLKVANAIKAQRIIDLANEKAGIKTSNRSKMLLIEWMKQYQKQKLESGQSERNSITIQSTISHLIAYKGNSIMMKDVDVNYCKGFISYLSKAKSFRDNNTISKSTANIYFTQFTSALNEAVRKKIIPVNPARYLAKDEKKVLKSSENKRGYLDMEEVKRLIATDHKNKQVKQSFLFAVFCGLRISDIRSLRWGDIEQEGGQWKVSLLMVKTKERLYLPLSNEAVKWLPERGDASKDDFVFNHLPKTQGLNYSVKIWAKKAGITKNICFHVSRHTFATLLLANKADLYTVSKLLGHTHISTTQIYADIVNEKKAEAVNLLGKAFENAAPDTDRRNKI